MQKNIGLTNFFLGGGIGSERLRRMSLFTHILYWKIAENTYFANFDPVRTVFGRNPTLYTLDMVARVILESFQNGVNLA